MGKHLTLQDIWEGNFTLIDVLPFIVIMILLMWIAIVLFGHSDED